MPRVSVIIPAYNEEDVIDECLESLTQQTYQDFEALIVDDQSTDKTSEKIRSWQKRYPDRISLKAYGKVGPGRARNLAAQESKGEILAFMDADCIATPTWIEKLLEGFSEASIGSVGGPHIAPASSSKFQNQVEAFFKRASWITDFYKRDPQKIVETSHNPLCNVAYRREVFQKIGGFREDLFPGEDTEIDFKVKDLGYRILYNPFALVYHHRPENIQAFQKVMRAYGRAQGKLLREYGVRRGIQRLGLFSIGFFMGCNIVIIWQFQLSGLLTCLSFSSALIGFRPRWNNTLGIYFAALGWFNGFIEGLFKNQSLPPGYSGRPPIR